MKNLVAFIVVALFTVTSSQAAEVSIEPEADGFAYLDSKRDQDKTEMQVTALPAEVRESLRQETTNGWVAQKAWKIREKNETCYKVELEKDGQNRKLKFNSDGERMDEDHDMKDKDSDMDKR